MSDRRASWLILGLLFALAVPFGAVRAETPCPIPDDLVLRGVKLPIAREAAVSRRRLSILVIGGAHTAGDDAGAREASYPARLEADLAAALPGVAVTVAIEGVPGGTAADIPPKLPAFIEKTGANLVIWGPGGRDVALRLDKREFADAVDAGIEAARHSGADLILMDMLFLPSPTRMALIEPYRERLKQAVLAGNVPFLPRHDMMRHWIADGTLNLDAQTPGERQRVAARMFSCIAQSLAAPIAAAVR